MSGLEEIVALIDFHLLALLDARALLRLAAGCRGLRGPCSEGDLWRRLCVSADPRARALLVGARKPGPGIRIYHCRLHTK